MGFLNPQQNKKAVLVARPLYGHLKSSGICEYTLLYSPSLATSAGR